MEGDELAELAGKYGWDPARLPGYTRITVATLIAEVPLLLYGALVTVPAGGDGIAIYDGKDASSGLLFGTVIAAASVTAIALLPHPVPFRAGLYVGVMVGLTEATLLWRPMLPDELEAWR